MDETAVAKPLKTLERVKRSASKLSRNFFSQIKGLNPSPKNPVGRLISLSFAAQCWWSRSRVCRRLLLLRQLYIQRPLPNIDHGGRAILFDSLASSTGST
jgi:hypothetical protein